MPAIHVKYVASFSSQDPKHTVEDLVKGRGSWLSQPGDKSNRLQADLQLEWATTITYIDIGNAGSVMASIEVGRSSWPATHPLVTLLPAVTLMTPDDWRMGKNKNTVRMFKPDDLNGEALREKWDKVRIVCIQPFRKIGQFGLSLFRIHTSTQTTTQTSPGKSLKDVDVIVSETDSKKEELISRMNLPVTKKKTISQKIGWLENKVLNNWEEEKTSLPVNPITSPVSRAAHLISMAEKPPTKETADKNKSEVEHEALEFLISLNLSVDDIYSLKVVGVRQQFEKHRHKQLNYDEKVIFKNIALDYAKRRLENLEKQQENEVAKTVKKNERMDHESIPFEARKENNVNSNTSLKLKETVRDSESKRLNSDISAKILKSSSPKCVGNTSSLRPPGKFTFKRIESSGQSSDLAKKLSRSPSCVSSDRQKLRQCDDLSADTFEPLSSLSRNGLALVDSKVTSKNPSSRKPKKSLTPQSSNRPSNLDVWISPKAKCTEPKPFTYSSHKVQKFVSELEDVDSGVCVIDDDDDELNSASASTSSTAGGFMDDTIPWKNANPKNKASQDQSGSWNSRSTASPSGGTSSGHCLGGVPVDKYDIASSRKRHRGDSLETGSLSSQDHPALVKCPLCSEFFQATKIEGHAASCGTVISSGSDSDDDDVYCSSIKKKVRQTDEVEECPVCGDLISSSKLESHATDCANTMYG